MAGARAESLVLNMMVVDWKPEGDTIISRRFVRGRGECASERDNDVGGRRSAPSRGCLAVHSGWYAAGIWLGYQSRSL